MFKSRIWKPNINCELNQYLNLDSWSNPAQNINSNSKFLDTRIITISQLVRSDFERVSMYKAIDLGSNGSLINTHFHLNVSLDLIDTLPSLYVSPFGSLMGRFDNVSVSGFVNISLDLNKIKDIKLSKLIGYIGLACDSINHHPEYNDEFCLRNASSSLRYYINGVEIITQTELNGAQINIQNAFDQDINVTINTYDLNNDPNIHHFTYQLTDSVVNKIEYITAWFPFPLNFGGNDNNNALNDLYPYPLQISQEKYYETKGMTQRRFNANGIEVDFPFLGTTIVIYQENTKAVAMINEKFIICSGSQVFDLKSKNCITRDQCFEKLDQFTFQSTCVLQCPKNYYIFNQTCFQTCPQYLGAYKSSGYICSQAQSLYYATYDASVQICSQYIFKKGCYASCPSGTVISGQNCLEPAIISNCLDGEYLVLSGQTDVRFYNQCTKLAPVWMYRDIDKQNKALGTYKDTCSGVISLNNDCQELSSPYQKNNGLCQLACASGQYQQSSTQACNDCLSTIYDGGLILDPNGNKCTTSCIKYTLSGTRKICQDNFPENCLFWKVISVGQYLCQDSCLNNQFTDGQVCSSCDPSKNQVADKINGGCKCVLDYFIKKLSDGSIKCTECDTSLRLQDSKVNGECICLEGQVWVLNRCKSNCLPTQVYLPEATSCSYCTSSELVPNLNQDACVPKTSCSPGFLNLAGTFCIVSCFDESAFYNQQSQCVTCASIDALSQFSVNSCVCVLGASKATPTSQCSCNIGFSTQANSCECSKKITADASMCADTCPETEVSIDNNIRCQTCSNQVPNVGQTACVAKTACAPGFLNIAQIKCIANCALDKAGAGPNNQCLQCQIINPLSIFKTTSCECTPNAVGSGTACTCNIANGFQTPDCSCSQKLSSNGTICSEKCPSTEVFLPNTIQCSKCQINQIPNLNQDECVPKTSCSPGFLNLAGTFCIVSCFDESAFYNQQSQCVTCASIDALSQFSVNSCVCVLGASKATPTSQCSCNIGFSTQANSCECSKKITADASMCADTCPETEVSIDNNIRCQTCSNQVPNVGQTACVAKTACAPGFLNIAQIKCIANCALDKAGAGPNNQCLQCQIINPLSIFKTTSCECTPNAVGSGTACTCNIANGFQTPDCSCSQKLSSNGTICSEKCPSTEVFLPNTIQCSKCQINQIPNLNQDACENTLCKVEQFVYERRCYDQCPTGTTKTRLQTCIKSSHSCCKSSIISGCSEPAGSSVALGFAFLPCSHTLEAWRRSRCPSSGGVAVSLLTMFYCDCFIVQSVGDQTGVTQLGFFVSARHCQAAVLAQERVCNLWQILGKQIH
ncbi:putative [Hexamita inflata]|uniref:Putative n=1 Tax=Hexamita inflata TaxID=28002 RepID=A0AA86QAL9_9EUKA|nr:putative [Hexamita inflata]